MSELLRKISILIFLNMFLVSLICCGGAQAGIKQNIQSSECISSDYYPLWIVKGSYDPADQAAAVQQWKSVTKKKIDEYISENSLSKDRVEQLESISVCEGMTEEEVMLLWDSPIAIKKVKGLEIKADEKWEYNILWYFAELYFQNNILTEIKRTETSFLYWP